MGNVELVIKIDEEKYNVIKSDLYNTLPSEMKELGLEAIRNGIPLSELRDKWKSSYEQMVQEKIDELNKRKIELENQLNISVQNNIVNEMITCCSAGSMACQTESFISQYQRHNIAQIND